MNTLVSSLPAQLHDPWNQIDAMNNRLVEALESGDLQQMTTIAAERHQHIVDFFESFPIASETAEIRLGLLRQLIGSNDQLLANACSRLEEAADESAASRHTRKGIAAYMQQDDQS